MLKFAIPSSPTISTPPPFCLFLLQVLNETPAFFNPDGLLFDSTTTTIEDDTIHSSDGEDVDMEGEFIKDEEGMRQQQQSDRDTNALKRRPSSPSLIFASASPVLALYAHWREAVRQHIEKVGEMQQQQQPTSSTTTRTTAPVVTGGLAGVIGENGARAAVRLHRAYVAAREAAAFAAAAAGNTNNSIVADGGGGVRHPPASPPSLSGPSSSSDEDEDDEDDDPVILDDDVEHAGSDDAGLPFDSNGGGLEELVAVPDPQAGDVVVVHGDNRVAVFDDEGAFIDDLMDTFSYDDFQIDEGAARDQLHRLAERTISRVGKGEISVS